MLVVRPMSRKVSNSQSFANLPDHYCGYLSISTRAEASALAKGYKPFLMTVSISMTVLSSRLLKRHDKEPHGGSRV